MGWQADTAHKNVGVGTSLHITESPTIVGEPARQLGCGDKLPIHHTSGTVTKSSVVKVAMGQAEIQLQDGTRWLMTPLDSRSDLPTMIHSPGLNSQDWIIRSQLA